jgi:hypothetical protein
MEFNKLVDQILTEAKKKKKPLVGGQKKLAAMAEPKDKLDGKDFAVMRAMKNKKKAK